MSGGMRRPRQSGADVRSVDQDGGEGEAHPIRVRREVRVRVGVRVRVRIKTGLRQGLGGRESDPSAGAGSA